MICPNCKCGTFQMNGGRIVCVGCGQALVEQGVRRSENDREAQFERLWKTLAGFIHDPFREYRFHDDRRWRLDFAWPNEKVGVEIQGGTWLKQRTGHSTATGIQRDAEKHNAATLNGWALLIYTSKDLDSRPHSVIDEVRSLIRMRSNK